ncbi:cation:proton antiporter [Sphingomonas profundi]|uniref:cation:proton antiporter n=1 Tax=Alterirhizorhabdus profundi TaxID=2681549 RepID=UPI0012E77D66|nr:sodium:proton antiporter [Sphingomonas profundi]
MTFFESLLALLLGGILLLQVSRRFCLPYPALLAAAGVGLAFVPGAPQIRIDPALALPLFIAPALLDAAFDFPAGVVWRLWRPLFALAVVAVLLTAAVVAWIGWAFAGLPIAAAVALGAIVAPPDAAASMAVLNSVSMPRRTLAVLKGESLLNDATALLLFTAAVAVQQHGGIDGTIALELGLEAPGGIALGVGLAWLYRRIVRFVAGTLGGNLLEFVNTFWVWIIAEKLHLSAVLCVVAFAMTIARTAALRQPPRVRLHSYAVWETVVFLLNVLAFLLMGMQVRIIVGRMPAARLEHALGIAGLVILGVILVRLVWVIGYNRVAKRVRLLRGDYEPATLAQGVLVGWCGMRGLLTVATAFALPGDFPERDVIVLTAFAVVLATLVVQGATVIPLIRLLKLSDTEDLDRELASARTALAEAATGSLDGEPGDEAEHLRYAYRLEHAAVADPPSPEPLERRRALGLRAITAERKRLEALRATHEVGPDTYQVLQEELDFRALALTSDDERQIEAN